MKLSRLRVLITGGAGFIGKHLLNSMQGIDCEIYCVVRDPSKLLFPVRSSFSLFTIQGDLGNPNTYSQLPDRIDVIIHLAASLGRWGMSTEECLGNNVLVTMRMLEWFKRVKGRQFILISTPGVQGLGYKLAKETAPYHPRGLYEISKVLSEKKVTQFNYRPGQYWTILRPDFVYGPGDLRRIKLYRRIKNQRWFTIGDGKSVLRPTYVEDVARAIGSCMGHRAAQNEIFNVAGPDVIPVHEYTRTIANIVNVNERPLTIPVPLIKMAGYLFEAGARITGTQPLMTTSQVDFLTQDHGTDINKIRQQVGFSPQVGFEQGMRQTIEWARNHNLL